MMSHYIQYYVEQIGGGRGVKNVYEGSVYQRSSSIGSFLGSIFRNIVKGAKDVDKEAVRTGTTFWTTSHWYNVLDDEN